MSKQTRNNARKKRPAEVSTAKPGSRRSGAEKKQTERTTKSQRAYLRQLRLEQAQQSGEQSLRQPGIPMWGRMLIAVAVVLALMLVFFRVTEFEVSGNVRYTAQEVADASGITEGDVLMGVSKVQAASHILVKLPYVEQVTVEKVLPGTVRFTVRECQAFAAATSEFGTIWLMNQEGKLLEELDEDAETAYPVITGTVLELPLAGGNASFQSEERGSLAMEVAAAVESAGLQSQIQSIDVTSLTGVTLVYQDRIEVLLGDGSDLEYKLAYLLGAAEELGDSARGTLDLSFSSRQQAVFHPLA